MQALEFAMNTHIIAVAILVLISPHFSQAQSVKDLPATRVKDVIYGRKFGLALTMDVFTAKKDANGSAIVLMVSGGWISDPAAIDGPIFGQFLAEPIKRGYTVFAVVHASQPKFTIPDAVTDVTRAVRFIRHNAKTFKIDPDRIGVTGASAGGHLSLMLGTTGAAGNSKAPDPVERASSRVQAVACIFPPTDFLNYGGKGKYAFAPDGLLERFRLVIDVRDFDPKTKQFERVSDEKRMEIARKMSPITHVSEKSAPTLIIHGDADALVPISQAEALMARFKEEKAVAELVVRKGRGHDFSKADKDFPIIIDWFDRHLVKKSGS